MTRNVDLSVVIPVFNEENTIVDLFRILIFELSQIDSCEYEIIVVDDGSSDSTKEKCQKMIFDASLERFKLICLDRNMGKGKAVQTGVANANGKYILVQDGDLEYSPSDIGSLFQSQKNLGNAGVTYGSRYISEDGFRATDILFKKLREQSWLAFYFNSTLSLLLFIKKGYWVTDLLTGYKMYPKVLFNEWAPKSSGFETDHEITNRIIELGWKISEIPISYSPRSKEEGKKIGWRDGIKALKMIL